MSAAIVPYKEEYLSELRDIFFEASIRKDFKNEDESSAFFFKYVGYYLVHYPDLAFVAVEDRVLGYVLGAPSSFEAELNKIQPHLALFERYFVAYPAHLHINCRPDTRGKGIGSMLVQRFEASLHKRGVPGLHIMTSYDAYNKKFYKKLGFHEEVVKEFKGSRILLMGKGLSER
jgi:ribosomal protein S18 acetylase RimI-like enzyme